MAAALWVAPASLRAQTAGSAEQGTAAQGQAPADIVVPLPKGKKLVMTDGSFQVAREYQREGDRVRYYSLERSDWEEIPASMVDWAATQKAEAEQSAQDQALLDKIKASEKAVVMAEIEVDTSFEARPGVQLPDKWGFYALAGTEVVTLEQSLAVSHLSKARTFERLASGMPLIPEKRFIDIPKRRAKVRIRTKDLEFFFRPADRRNPKIQLLRVEIQGDQRKMETMSTDMVGQNKFKGDEIPLTVWEPAPGLYRYTMEKPLGPGEYALVETTEKGEPDLYVWDFGLDVAPEGKGSSAAGRAK